MGEGHIAGGRVRSNGVREGRRAEENDRKVDRQLKRGAGGADSYPGYFCQVYIFSSRDMSNLYIKSRF
jgi:hypothetical protein